MIIIYRIQRHNDYENLRSTSRLCDKIALQDSACNCWYCDCNNPCEQTMFCSQIILWMKYTLYSRKKQLWDILKETCDIAKMSARCTIWQYAHGLLLESLFVPSSTDCWVVRAKLRQP